MIRIDNIQIDEDYYTLLIHLLMDKTGLNLDCYQRNFVEKRIKSRMIRVKSDKLKLYYEYILENPDETEKFLDCFNINYSVFFRNWEVFKQLEDIILYSLYLSKRDIISDLTPNPKRQYRSKISNYSVKSKIHDSKIKQKSLIARFISQTSLYKKIWNPLEKQEYINIWSCPCANGEEPYSIAMILDNLKDQIPGFPLFRIIASDIDNKAIKRAKIGIYNEDSTKNVSKYYEKKYLTKNRENFGFVYLINQNIRDYITFIEEDVIKGHHNSYNYDIIFCRYLLIYISRTVRDEFLKIIRNRLNPGGLLILGKTEFLSNPQCDLKLIDSFNRIYMKVR